MEHILPKSPNPFIKNDADATPAVLGHINYLIDYLIPYKVYSALISQSSTDAPTVIVLQNTLGDITFEYYDVGKYLVISDGLFILNKTWMTITQNFDQGIPLDMIYTITGGSLNQLIIQSGNPSTETPQDGLLDYTPIEIRVYK